MGTVHYARKVVGYASEKLLGLAWMYKDDAPMIWETIDVVSIQV